MKDIEIVSQTTMNKIKRHIYIIGKTFLIGYIGGALVASQVLVEYGNGFFENTIGRIIGAIMFCFVSMESGGFVPKDFIEGKEFFNIWPYIIVCWGIFLYGEYSLNEKEENSSYQNDETAKKDNADIN